ncbi:NAD-dependent epimerase [Planomonospora venezuelensis]|uniref:Nucleoside-diphosphate-sugar epimerase n=1 Tax=Planomonospora venezuelensis TaxID=1999 RepID=A0A841D6D6_PLAVE|nr:NAD-dependent epimerase [Planomonospora venezuelensis]MBB5964037.1 nucleoside-diphosphate-sugar epimerase [Planomonospora venezuelensis]GIM99659.1 NAD-dependent epimerase [Planomonospora venezuelensis]
MTFHVIIGAGAAASRTALLLAADGERVRIVSRSGGGPDHPLVEKTAADAADADRLTRLLEGAATLYGCAAPPYHRWPQEFPALAGAALTAAARTGARYVMLGNLYGYGLVTGPLHPGLPLEAAGPKGRLRARLWEEAAASGVQVTEVRAAQFYGAGAVSVFSLMVQPRVLAGALALVPQDLDLPHSYSSIGDTARTLVAAGRDERSWGRAWHAPAVTPSVRELAARLAELAGAPLPRLEELTERDLALLALTDPFWAELTEVLEAPGLPYVSDFTETEKLLGVTATPVEEVLAELL